MLSHVMMQDLTWCVGFLRMAFGTFSHELQHQVWVFSYLAKNFLAPYCAHPHVKGISLFGMMHIFEQKPISL